ncbi:MAG: DUF2382 domain-containing protein [Nitrososphaerota archaeon]
MDVVSIDQNKDEHQLDGEIVPLIGTDREMEMTIPLYAEQVIISKRKVKVADLRIHKMKVIETKKLDIDLFTEKLTIRNPTGGASHENE